MNPSWTLLPQRAIISDLLIPWSMVWFTLVSSLFLHDVYPQIIYVQIIYAIFGGPAYRLNPLASWISSRGWPRPAVGAFSYFADGAVRKQMRIMRSLSAQKVRSCFRCNLKLSGLRDQRRINRPSENRLGIPCVRGGSEKGIESERQVARRKRTLTGQREDGGGRREGEREQDSGEEAKWEGRKTGWKIRFTNLSWLLWDCSLTG